MLYVTEGGSYQGVSTLMSITGDIQLNKNAVRKRIQGSWRWLRWMGEKTCKEGGYSIEKPEWLKGRRVILADASDMALRGSRSSDYRLHYGFDLFGFGCTHMEVTSVKEGEKLSRYAVEEEDILIGDRIYCNIKGIEYVLGKGGSFILRMKHRAFLLYDEEGKQIDLLERLRKLEAWESVSIDAFYRLEDRSLRPVRIVGTRKDEETARKSMEKRKRTATRKQQPLRPETAEMSQYIVVATNLEDTDARVLELYRARWQIEQVFYRLKALFAFGEIPSGNPDSVRAWFYGKLLLAALCEAMLKNLPFPPQENHGTR